MSRANVAAFLAVIAGVAVLQSGASPDCLTSVLGAGAAWVGGSRSQGACLLQLPTTQMSKKMLGTGFSQGRTFWGYEFEVLETPLALLQGASTERHVSLQDLVQPSSEPYSLSKGTDAPCYGQWGQDSLLYPILGQIKNGFFVESGAFDGEEGSNTLMYELKGWKGLLVEPGPFNFEALKAKHRRAYAFKGALSPTKKMETLKFSGSGTQNEHLSADGSYEVKATPLADLMKVVNQSTVDFWSLDIEGSEGIVLENTDFSKVEVGVLLIEMNKNGENNDRVNAVMKKEGFIDIGTSLYNEGMGWQALDHVFVNPKYFAARGLAVPSKVDVKHGGC